MKMNVVELQEQLTARWLANGFEQLAKPEDTIDNVYNCAFKFTGCKSEKDFYAHYWEPCLDALERTMREDGVTRFYSVVVYYIDDDTLYVASSPGVIPEIEFSLTA